jgi:hypothetical protein
MASHHDDEPMPEETQGYKLSQPKQSLAEYKNMGTYCFFLVFSCLKAEFDDVQTQTTNPYSDTRNHSA